MPELRIDPIVGRRVYVAEDRAGRPNDFVDESLRDLPPVSERPVHVEGCPFCAGNEAATPHEAAVVRDAAGAWQVRVVPNKYPAMTLDGAAGGGDAPARGLDGEGALGAHEVIIESPRHLLDVVELSVDELATVLGVYRDRLRHWAADGRFVHGLIFKNSGCAAGASLLHVHSQLVALPYVPEAVQAELAGAERFFQLNQRCVFCDVVSKETLSRERLVVHQHGFAAFCAYAGRQPLETWIVPEEHGARFDRVEDGELHRLALVLHEVLRRLYAVLPGAAYNLVLHSGPFSARGRGSFATGDELSPNDLASRKRPPTPSRDSDSYHWHWELIPRVANLAGLELGAGVYINPLSPEHAAERLRGVEG